MGMNPVNAETIRPSASVTWSESISASTAVALESVLTFAEASNVHMPCVPYLLFVLFDQFSNLFELLAEKAVGFGQQDWVQPEFGILLSRLNVNMDWFFRLSAENIVEVSQLAFAVSFFYSG
jgi:hypothetical protein